jgi:hypothetical protein
MYIHPLKQKILNCRTNVSLMKSIGIFVHLNMEDKLVYSYSDGELLCSVLGKRKGKGLADERSR